ncbi:DUF1090 domain-containing protein [Zestomonas carbonaria]|uniref:Protein YqjC n=1 Tax=Zestomonas carbonaria TaxID=2762745 RepID=A0A7U7EMD6_9GAMM|nr:DUF1090 domain-containing protein [Pseudomonas carbonaria]CAD5107323.1 Protein YqjC [Pseudomonas carbonaria]
MLARHLLPAFLLATCAALPLASSAGESTGCAAKREDILTKLEEARAHSNHHRQAGLEKALREVEEHCDDGSLRKAREEKVREARHKVSEREAELREEMDDGDDLQKIEKRRNKLAEAREELRKAEAELER